MFARGLPLQIIICKGGFLRMINNNNNDNNHDNSDNNNTYGVDNPPRSISNNFNNHHLV